jgi:hypothetical protein
MSTKCKAQQLFLKKISIYCYKQGCGSGSGTGTETFGRIRIRSGTEINVSEKSVKRSTVLFSG